MQDRLRIVMIASEVTPFAKTGGLADVAGALSKALASRGHDVHVILPLYGTMDRKRHGITGNGGAVEAWLPGGSQSLGVHTMARDGAQGNGGVGIGSAGNGTSGDGEVGDRQSANREPTFWFLSHPLFERDGLYGDSYGEFGDNHLRFALLSRGALDLCRQRIPSPDILHLHDWQTSLAAVDLRSGESPVSTSGFEDTKLVFTIHNLAYMGRFEPHRLGELGYGPSMFTPDTLEFYGAGALIKGGLIYSDILTTVSPRYSREIQTPEFGHGLEGLLYSRAQQLFGILNGIDTDEWNPATDRHLPATYSADDLSGKVRCKAALQTEMGLDVRERAPLFGVVARLAWQKGIDLIADVAQQLADRGGQLAILGTGEPALEQRLSDLARRFPGRLAVRLGFDEGLAHRIEAGSDAFLMPSRYEPCGLNQMYSLRYGTVPVVRAVGGLDDTVEELDSQRGSGNGFKFGPPLAESLWWAIDRALATWARPEVWRGLQQRGMSADFSWNASAATYERLYLHLSGRGLDSPSHSPSRPATVSEPAPDSPA